EDLMLLNDNKEWIVEPGEFKVMIGASSEDIRLSESFYVLGDGFDINSIKTKELVVSNPQSSTGLNVLDGKLDTYWIGNRGYTLTFPLDNERVMSNIGIQWGERTDRDAVFEIQISSGGGQFLTVYKGSPQYIEKLDNYQFRESTGTDLRIRVVSGYVEIAEIGKL